MTVVGGPPLLPPRVVVDDELSVRIMGGGESEEESEVPLGFEGRDSAAGPEAAFRSR